MSNLNKKILSVIYTRVFKYAIVTLMILFLITMLTLSILQKKEDSAFHLTAKFSDSGPLHADMPVYYKGYYIGITEDVEPSKDYKYTFLKIKLYPKNPKIPDSVIAKVKHYDEKKDYIDLSIPDDSSTVILKKGSTIDGEGKFDVESFLADIANSGLIIPLLETFSDTLASINKTSVQIEGFFSDSQKVLKDNKQNIKQTTTELAHTSNSISQLTSNFNNTITKDKINDTTSSINKSTNNVLNASENIKSITESINKATKNMDKTVAKIDCTISETNKIATNVKVITCGIRETLEKRFAGMRIMFGKPIDGNKCTKNCSR